MKIKYLWLVLFSLSLAASLPAGSPVENAADRQQVQSILAAHDRLQPGIDDYFASVADDLILMPNRGDAIEGKAAYRRHVEDFYASGKISIRHEVLAVYSLADVVLVRGRAIGTFVAPGQQEINKFETKNLFVFRRISGGKLQVWQIIFNDAPPRT
jgi:ketosteroid isomerase-like protein